MVPVAPLLARYGHFQTQKKGCSEAALRVALCFLAIEHVHCDFKAKAHFGVFGFGPHGKAPLRVNLLDQASRPLHHDHGTYSESTVWLAPQENPEIRLMIFIRFATLQNLTL